MKRLRLLLAQAVFGVGVLSGLAFGADCASTINSCAQQGINPGSCRSQEPNERTCTQHTHGVVAGRTYYHHCCYSGTTYTGCPGGRRCSIWSFDWDNLNTNPSCYQVCGISA